MPFFALGNKKSLFDAMENGIDLRERIMKLFREFYHGGLMKLVVIGGGIFFLYNSPNGNLITAIAAERDLKVLRSKFQLNSYLLLEIRILLMCDFNFSCL